MEVQEFGTMNVMSVTSASNFPDQQPPYDEMIKLVLKIDRTNRKLKEQIDKVETRLNYVVIRPLSGFMNSHDFLKQYV